VPHPVALRSARTLLGLSACLLLLAATPAFAQGAIERQLDELKTAIEAQRSQLQDHQRQLATQAAEIDRLKTQVAEAAVPAATVEELRQSIDASRLAAQEAARVTMVANRPTIASADGRSSLAVRSVMQLDIADHHEDTAGSIGTDFRRGSVGAAPNRETDAARDLSDGAYFRRARLGFEGLIARDFNYRVMIELGGAGTEGPTRINDAWIAYTGFAPFQVQLGAFSPPANMDDGTSVDGLVFIERATPAELSRVLGGADGRIGLGVRGSGQRWMSSVTLTTRTVNDAESFDSQLAVVSRFGWLAATSPDFNIHTGASLTWVFEPADQGSAAPIRFRDRPEIRVDSTRLIDTGSIDADAAYAAGLEFGMNWKNWYLQAEHFWYGIERPEASPLPDPSFGGYYVQGSWLITGESRRYDMASGAFQAPRPFVPFTARGGTGAWELALRYSHTDLNESPGLLGSAATPASVRGGEQNVWTLGVSWYLNSSVRLMFNWLRIDADRLNPAGPGNLTPFGPSPATPPLGVDIGQDLDIFAVRSQYSF
jgi:phosphate-selective porin OprO and OprP